MSEEAPKKPLNHPDYEIAPGVYNLSAWSRENEPKGPPRFKVGDRVRFTDTLYVHRVGQDCDGTPLFALGREDPSGLDEVERARPNDWIILHALSADSLEPAE